MTLREARELRGWTQEQLEAASGVDQAHISKLERREVLNPSNDTAAKLEAALRVRRGTLVFGVQVTEARA
jgi:transcriptional regulator with XRE-family HTH domain